MFMFVNMVPKKIIKKHNFTPDKNFSLGGEYLHETFAIGFIPDVDVSIPAPKTHMSKFRGWWLSYKPMYLSIFLLCSLFILPSLLQIVMMIAKYMVEPNVDKFKFLMDTFSEIKLIGIITSSIVLLIRFNYHRCSWK